MRQVALWLIFWTLLFSGAILWDYRHQRYPGIDRRARALRRLRMLSVAACGFATLWMTLNAAGLTRRGEVQEQRALAVGPFVLAHSRAVEVPPPEAAFFDDMLRVGLLTAMVWTLFLHVVVPRTQHQPLRSERSGGNPGGPDSAGRDRGGAGA
jgi:hypothetical protein